MPGLPVPLAFFAAEGRIELLGRLVGRPEERVTMLRLDACSNTIDLKRCTHPEHACTA